MTLTADQIPPEAWKAAGLALLEELDAIAAEMGETRTGELSPRDQENFRRVALAAIAAALNAWPGMGWQQMTGPNDALVGSLILPLPTKASDAEA